MSRAQRAVVHLLLPASHPAPVLPRDHHAPRAPARPPPPPCESTTTAPPGGAGPVGGSPLSIRPRVPERCLSGWPHGLIGQSFYGDGLAVSGRQDGYKPGVVWTEAQAKGPRSPTRQPAPRAPPLPPGRLPSAQGTVTGVGEAGVASPGRPRRAPDPAAPGACPPWPAATRQLQLLSPHTPRDALPAPSSNIRPCAVTPFPPAPPPLPASLHSTLPLVLLRRPFFLFGEAGGGRTAAGR